MGAQENGQRPYTSVVEAIELTLEKRRTTKRQSMPFSIAASVLEAESEYDSDEDSLEEWSDRDIDSDSGIPPQQHKQKELNSLMSLPSCTNEINQQLYEEYKKYLGKESGDMGEDNDTHQSNI